MYEFYYHHAAITVCPIIVMGMSHKSGEKEGPAQVHLNRFEVLRDRVIQRGEGSGKEVEKDRREILREERTKKNIQAQTSGKDKKEKRKGVNEKKDEKIEEEREVEMQGFSRGEILKGRYPLVWWKVQCYECGGLGHRRRDHGFHFSILRT